QKQKSMGYFFKSKTQSCVITLLAWSVLGALDLTPARGAGITLGALEHDGYGVVTLKRPLPNMLVVLAEIDGRKYNLVVDTGWASDGIALLTDHRGAARGATEEIKDSAYSASGAEIKGMRKGVGQVVEIGNVQVKQVPLIYGNFKGLKDEFFRRKGGIDGVLGAGFLRNCSAVIDLHNLRLYLRPPGGGHRVALGPALQASGLSEVQFAMSENHICIVDVEVNGTPSAMVLDTGAYSAGIDSRMATKLGASAIHSRVGSVDAAGKRAESKLMQLKSFKIGGVKVRAPDMRVNSYGFYNATGGKVVGLLGMDILGTNGTIIDFGSRKLYFYGAQ
ncbi:MAG: aspartyl protease family protein, partial [Chthoniobacterales bacterium]